MPHIHLPPVAVAEMLIGNPETLSRIAGLHPKTAYLWRRLSARRDKGDVPGAQIMRALLNHAREHRLGLTAEHLIYGAPLDEVRAVLARRGLTDAEIAAMSDRTLGAYRILRVAA